jgi:hypothetical protein
MPPPLSLLMTVGDGCKLALPVFQPLGLLINVVTGGRCDEGGLEQVCILGMYRNVIGQTHCTDSVLQQRRCLACDKLQSEQAPSPLHRLVLAQKAIHSFSYCFFSPYHMSVIAVSVTIVIRKSHIGLVLLELSVCYKG